MEHRHARSPDSHRNDAAICCSHPFTMRAERKKNSLVDCFSEGASRCAVQEMYYLNPNFLCWPRPLTVAAGHPLFENSVKIQRCLTPKAFGGVCWISELRK